VKGPRAIRLEAEERPEREDDMALIVHLEACELGYDWERRVLEEASHRVYSDSRPLMPNQRKAVEEIIARRRGAPGRAG
jgi:hypothetical protein